jgi:predicted RNA-binding Zn ribbon-like protein
LSTPFAGDILISAMSSSHAPGRLAVIQDFINTLEPNVRDDIGDVEQAGAWIEQRRLPGSVTGTAEHRQLLDLRSALSGVLLANAGHGQGADWEALQPFGDGVRLCIRSGPELRLEPAVPSNVEATIGALLAIVYDAVRDGTWSRLKICRDDACAWAFYDRSKNGSGAWCSMKVCGNRAKARRRRVRERQP